MPIVLSHGLLSPADAAATLDGLSSGAAGKIEDQGLREGCEGQSDSSNVEDREWNGDDRSV